MSLHGLAGLSIATEIPKSYLYFFSVRIISYRQFRLNKNTTKCDMRIHVIAIIKKVQV